MGSCCSSGSKELTPEQDDAITSICNNELSSAKVAALLAWIVPFLKNESGKKEGDIFHSLRNDDRPLSFIVGKPNELDGNKAMPEYMDSAEKHARIKALRTLGNDLRDNKALGLEEEQDLKRFIANTVYKNMTICLQRRITALYDPEAAMRKVKQDEEDAKAVEQAQQLEEDKESSVLQSVGSFNKKSQQQQEKEKTSPKTSTTAKKTSHIEPTSENIAATKKPASNVAASSKTTTQQQQQQQTKTQTKTQQQSQSQSQTKTSAAAAQKKAPSPKKVKPQGPPPPLTGPEHADNIWLPCDDCDYYWNEYKQLYFDPLPTKKLFYDFAKDKWMKNEPKRN